MSAYLSERQSRKGDTGKETTSSAGDLQNPLEDAIVKILKVIEPAENGVIFLWDEAAMMLRPAAFLGYDPQKFTGLSLQRDESFLGEVFVSGEARIYTSTEDITTATDNMSGPNLELWLWAHGKDFPPRGLVAAPISSSDQKHGVIMVETFAETPNFSEHDLAVIQLTADLIAMRLERDNPWMHPVSDLPGGPIRTEWIETLSHELGMPLTAIKGYASALLLDEVDWSLAKRQEFLQLIEDECDLMEALLSDLLNSAIIDLDTFSLDLQPLRLSQIARVIAEEMDRRTEKHRLIVDFPSNMPLVKGDARWIKQVFRNLLDNAIKYSPNGGLVVIRGEVRPTDVVISISDQGMGIPPEDSILIFEKYERAESYLDREITGSGLGLPIARRIIEVHGGHIWVNSKINQGTTLSFSLPHEMIIDPQLGGENEHGTHPDR